jgi:hypothetical protein
LAANRLKSTYLIAGIATLAFTVAGVTWFALDGSPQGLGLDGDNPGQMVRFVRDHPGVYQQSGVALLAMAVSLTIAALALYELFAPRSHALALRSTTAFALFAAAFFFVFGAMRIGSSEPLLHIAGLRADWGESAYVAVQMAGVQGLVMAGLFTLSLWAVGHGLIGWRSRSIPRWLCVLAVLPAIRVILVPLGLLGVLPDEELLWVLSIVAIFGLIAWCLLLGVVLLVRGLRSASASLPSAPVQQSSAA